MYNPEKPYNQLPLLPPKFKLTEKVYTALIKAHRILAELKGMARQIPNQEIIINTLVLREAKDSSEIENIVTTQDELYKAFSFNSPEYSPAVKEVLSYKDALWLGYHLCNKKNLITTREMVKIQECLVGNKAGIRRQAGTTLKNARTGKTVYTPPSGKDVIEDKLKNLEIFINTEDDQLDPLIKMAIIHYQFESIHPFYDGNGRTGRIINVLYLIHKNMLDLPILYMSSHIIKNKQIYYKGLDDVRLKQKWESWLVFMLEAVSNTAEDTMSTINRMKILFDKTVVNIKAKCPAVYSHELVECFFLQPYTRITHLENALHISRFTASKYLKQLEKAGILTSQKLGRDIIYIHEELFALLSYDN